MKKRMWMKVTKDKYQLPLAVAYSAKELSEMCNVTLGFIYVSAKAWREGRVKYTSYIDVIMEDETDADF